MEYYFYIILIFAIILKLTLYLCWYQVRRNAKAAREMRIIMPDGSTRYAVVTGASGVVRTRATSEERQCLPYAEAAVPFDNQGMVERPIQPRLIGVPQNTFTGPPPYLAEDVNQWKLPKYEELDDALPPYTPPEQSDNQGGTPAQPLPNTIVPNNFQAMLLHTTPSRSWASAIPTIPAATGTMAPTYATSPTTQSHIGAAPALGQGPSPTASPQNVTAMPVVNNSSTSPHLLPGPPE